MEELQKENAKLKHQVEKLTKENNRLNRLFGGMLEENNYLKDKVRAENKVRVRYLNFTVEPKPTLYLDHKQIQFKTSRGNTTRLLEALFRTETIEAMKETPVPIDELYDLIHSDDIEGDWFSLNKEQQEKAKSDIRGLFRNINNETKTSLNGEKLFIPDNNGFKLNSKVLF